jgi:hypothetical protein
MQNKSSQQRAARLWARFLCYCLRLVAAEDEDEDEDKDKDEDKDEEEHQHQHQKESPLQALVGTARLFPWDGRQKQAARMLWRIVLRNGGECADTRREVREHVLSLSEALICQDVCHQPFESGFIHFLAVTVANGLRLG